MLRVSRRLLVLAMFGAAALAAVAAEAAPGREGRLLTPKGFEIPVHGSFGSEGTDGEVTTACSRLSEEQIHAFYREETARAMLARGRQAVVQSAGIVFTILYTDVATGFNDPERGAERRAALEATALSWSNAIGGTIAVVIEARMESLPNEPNLLASASPTDFLISEGRILPLSLAAQLLNAPVNDGGSDLKVRFNADVDWDYDPSGNAAPGRVSFVYTALHELAHGLGFLSTFSHETGQLAAELPTPFDLLINRGTADGNRLVNRSPSEVLTDVLSGDLFFAGANAVQAGLASVSPLPMVKLYAPAAWEPGSSVSHVDQETYSDPSVGLMRPGDVGGAGTSIVDGLTAAMMLDLGYQPAAAAGAARRP